MALTALIGAYHESAEAGVLRATLPLAGRTVLERQVRLAAAAGAAPVVVLVERLPAELSAAIERLRRQRLPIHVARTAEEAASVIDHHDTILLIADGAVADRSELERVAAAGPPSVLTVPDSGFGELYERIDGATRWGAVAAIDGALLAETTAMLRDWDMQSTLLRRALQSGARHLPAQAPVAIIDAPAHLGDLERQIVAAASGASGGWASRLLAPLERAATHLLMGSAATPQVIGIGGAVLALFAVAAFAYGWLATGLGLMLVATPFEGIAARLARLRMQDDIERSWWCYLLPALAGAALVALAYALALEQGWGMVLLAFTTLAFLIALGIEGEGRVLRGEAWLADWKNMAWLMLPFALFGVWQGGLALLFAYAAGSFFWAQREAHAAPRSRQD